MKPLLPLAVLLAVMFAGCSKPDPYAKYRDVQLKRGMKIADIKQQFGEPDSFREWSSGEELNYGAFGAHDQKKGHITKHRLSMTFAKGVLVDWEKSAPIERE